MIDHPVHGCAVAAGQGKECITPLHLVEPPIHRSAPAAWPAGCGGRWRRSVKPRRRGVGSRRRTGGLVLVLSCRCRPVGGDGRILSRHRRAKGAGRGSCDRGCGKEFRDLIFWLLNDGLRTWGLAL
jgi:hypothetical protein